MWSLSNVYVKPKVLTHAQHSPTSLGNRSSRDFPWRNHTRYCIMFCRHRHCVFTSLSSPKCLKYQRYKLSGIVTPRTLGHKKINLKILKILLWFYNRPSDINSILLGMLLSANSSTAMYLSPWSPCTISRRIWSCSNLGRDHTSH